MTTRGPSKPVIIDSTGWYKTRNGFYVFIYTLPNRKTDLWDCRGRMHKLTKRGTLNKSPVTSAWHSSGLYSSYCEAPYDILEKQSPPQEALPVR